MAGIVVGVLLSLCLMLVIVTSFSLDKDLSREELEVLEKVLIYLERLDQIYGPLQRSSRSEPINNIRNTMSPKVLVMNRYEEVVEALNFLERLDRIYGPLSRPRFGRSIRSEIQEPSQVEKSIPEEKQKR